MAEQSISDLATALDSGEVTSRELVAAFLARIETFDQQGPALNAMVVINPNAFRDADALDAERSAGRVRGPLHGIPIVVKDNYDTVDMPTSAGTIGLATSVPPDDAFQVSRLREAGAIILGKTNMHELARGITTVSSIAGQTRNPYDITRNPGGSSGGTGAAVAASFAAVGMGSDTCGSIRIPSAHHALVGLRGTRGLASGDGIIPLSTTQDIGGPLARSVRDLAITLDATVGVDPADETTRRSEGRIPATYTDALDSRGLLGARVALLEELLGDTGAERPVRTVIEAAVEKMTAEGAEVVEIAETDFGALLEGASLIGLEFKFDFDAYLVKTPGAPVRSLAELVELGLYHQVVDRGIRASLEVESLDTDDYRERLAKRDTLREAVTALLDEHDLTALIYPTIRQTARPIGQGQPGSNCSLSAISGLPAITVPAGYAADGMPVGLEMIGRQFAEDDLIRLAYAYEQATRHRRAPDSTPSLVDPPAPVVVNVEADDVDGAGLRGRFVLERSTGDLTYTLSLYGMSNTEVLFTHLHRSTDGAAGPVVRLLGGRWRPWVSGALTLTAAELSALRDGELYADVHTTENLVGLRADLSWPEE
ncbi:MAG: glutamyl-tRNA amidotransferase [Acidobacteria bacterium]|nr:glutamyl-tRNA amidotransferase [Acidobacteriota bacterium]